MCGLTGFLNEKTIPTELALAVTSRMSDALTHRGPDAHGVWAEDCIALGHRRLSILDLSEAGAQPMHSLCGRFVLVFNGEIYNHAELRRSLEKLDAAPAWRGHSDTETLLAGFAHWGIDETLQRAHGMFALALWDRQLRKLSLARDRMGEKPLYWGWAGRAIVFGSELKALRAHPEFSHELCTDAVSLYFHFGYVPAPRSIYRHIYKLEPGCILEIDGAPPGTRPASALRPGERHGTLGIRRFWSLNDTLETGRRRQLTNEHDALNLLERSLASAVSKQTLSDVPLGAFLSGGIDSSLVASLMQKNSDRPIKTFTIGFDVAAFNEAPHAAAVAKHLGTDHTEMTVTQSEARSVIPLLPELYDEPFADSSQIPTYLVAKLAKSQVTVALSGDGGDELFGGYNRYFWGPRIWDRISWMPYPLRQLLGRSISAVPVASWDQMGAAAAKLSSRAAIAHPGDKAHKLAHRLQNVHSMDDLYRSLVTEWPAAPVKWASSDTLTSSIDDPLPPFLDEAPQARMMAQDLRSYLPDDILCKVDRAAMATSLETRVPLLDPDLVALSARLPLHMKIRDGKGKWALREILYRHVPKDLIERPKAGFGIPVGEWLRGPLRPWAEDLLSVEVLSRDDILDPLPIRKVWEEHLSRRRDWTVRLWYVLMFQAWRMAQSDQ
ncbi:asparagine synthase (glutamine-hydrolyzing) [Sedimentimonas flavescens]|uniref:asparagine synthase (glutamine-hydrolyzing) n=1 Tax=Sedimentimonas flavescens TaxID=2851012 RepID=A0ABT2ZVA0_9RHOB|nr:asparagine synthase (glutamine-hydrolyzing) [Sedimentimonas flavescens]MCV2877669.1 asparagine synthase (glutamine-hydrolyzing) [Sedimentimonas flavescens]